MSDDREECTDHVWRRVRHVIAPTGPPPNHTAFELLMCDCGACTVFPVCNYQLTTAEFRDTLIAGLEAVGLHFEIAP